ncbi:hypothetical protein OAE04_01255 [bacterium]|nr:hypothetical protein [Vicingaceae bacterium]MDC0004975.1 hypothetical protein [bacterium]|tara:strand:- start:42 stop:386 length:345 start_codon:yes stop_codon:yes gene_type:complete
MQNPNFLTELMQIWLAQYANNQGNSLTTMGLFHWEFRPNKHKPEKLRRIPRIDMSMEIKNSSFKHAVYFLEIDAETLHVFESSGIALGGSNIAHEYALKEEVFIKGKVLMKSIR